METVDIVERLEDLYELLSTMYYSELDIESSHLVALEHAVMLLENDND